MYKVLWLTFGSLVTFGVLNEAIVDSLALPPSWLGAQTSGRLPTCVSFLKLLVAILY
jgi:hypothetical protein